MNPNDLISREALITGLERAGILSDFARYKIVKAPAVEAVPEPPKEENNHD